MVIVSSISSRCSQLSGSLPNECKLVPDPNDPLCCEVASCSPAKTNTSTGYLIPTVPPGTVTGRQVTPTLAPGQVPQPEPGESVHVVLTQFYETPIIIRMRKTPNLMMANCYSNDSHLYLFTLSSS